jgi:alkylation response protein AidB-like acyl-CoA dehydrogenase
VDLLLDADQQAIADTAAGVLAKAGYPGALRALSPGVGIDVDLWRSCASLGWLGLGVPDELGGVGLGATHEVVLFRELGRHVAPGPFVATVAAAHLAAAAGDVALVAALVAGERTAAWAQLHGDGVQLIGAADPGVVLVEGGDGLELVDAIGLGPLRAVDPIDPSVALLRSDRVPDRATGRPDDGTAATRAALLSAAALVGLAEATRDLAAAYATDRMQFGKPIGTFQAVKHRCADMAIRAEAAWAQVCFAAAALDGGEDAARHVASAKVVAIDAAHRNAAGTVQVHGGMGFTAEHDAHLYVRRAHIWEAEGGGRRHHLARLLDP